MGRFFWEISGVRVECEIYEIFSGEAFVFLCNRWGVEHAPFEVPSNGQKHLVTYRYAEGETGTMEVIDGEEISMLPMYDVNIYEGWRDQYTGERF